MRLCVSTASCLSISREGNAAVGVTPADDDFRNGLGPESTFRSPLLDNTSIPSNVYAHLYCTRLFGQGVGVTRRAVLSPAPTVGKAATFLRYVSSCRNEPRAHPRERRIAGRSPSGARADRTMGTAPPTTGIWSQGDRSNRSHPPAVRLPASWGCWAAMSPSERRRPDPRRNPSHCALFSDNHVGFSRTLCGSFPVMRR